MTCENCGYVKGHSTYCEAGLRHPRPDDPYGVPTGVVPRVEYQPPLRRSAVARAAVLGDPIAQAVDDYLLMERKARAWDELREEVLRWAIGRDRDLVLELMGKLVHPAQPSASADR